MTMFVDRHRTDSAEDLSNMSDHGKSLFDVVMAAADTVDNAVAADSDDNDFCH